MVTELLLLLVTRLILRLS